MSAAYFVTLPTRVFLDRRLSLPALRLLGIIASHQTSADGWAHFDQAGLARQYDEAKPPSQQAISKHIAKLVMLGYIRIRHESNGDGQRTANGYSVINDSSVDLQHGNERVKDARKEHKPNCPCGECHPELWTFMPMVKGHASNCACNLCMRQRFKKTNVS